MNFLLIPIGAFMVIVALLILKEITPDTTPKKLLKALIIILFAIAFVFIVCFMQ